MRKYLGTLPYRSESHKKRFAFLVSGGFTAFVFVVWAVVNYGVGQNAVLAEQDSREPTPFESMGHGLAGAFTAIKSQFTSGVDEAKQGLESVDINSEYEAMRTSGLEIYGQ
jgi:hypothetical protein